jgi:dipeptidyl aminopeptidase/acylaminoacyl peptidase
VKRNVSIALGLLSCAVGFAQTAAPATAAAAKHPITASDLWKIQRVGSPALSPDGRTAAISVTEYSVAKSKPTSSLWLVDVAGGASRRLTLGGTDGSPAWSPDGTRIAFLSKRADDDVPALYVISIGGGEARRLAGLPYAIQAPRWLSNDRIAALTQVIPAIAGKLSKAELDALRKEVKRRKDSPMTGKATESRQYRFWDRTLAEGVADKLVAFDAETGALTDLTPGWNAVFATVMEPYFDASPDGRWIAMSVNTTKPPYSEHPNFDVYLIATDGSGSMRNLTADNEWADERPRFSPDGRSIVFARTTASNYQTRRLWRRDLASETNVALTASPDLSFDDHVFSPDGRSLYLTAEDHGSVAFYRIGADGRGLAKVYGSGTSSQVRTGASGVLFLHEDSGHPPELWVLDAGKTAPRPLTHFNDALVASWDLGKTESRDVTGAEGDRIQMWVTYPPAFDPAKKHPLVHIMHGGPHTSARDDFSLRWNPNVFAAWGYVVARVNRHGSTGFGQGFATSIDQHWGDRPTGDILAATEELAKVPGVDGDRVAATGASYGGYLAAWLLGHTDRFRCIVDHAGVNDVYAEYGGDLTTYIFDEKIWGGTPWKDADLFQKHNPIAYAKDFKTPILITAGESDYRVPSGNAIELYGVLQSMGVPSRLVLFPNENHWVLSPQNSIYWYWEVGDWLARYLGGPRTEKPVFPTEDKEEQGGEVTR